MPYIRIILFAICLWALHPASSQAQSGWVGQTSGTVKDLHAVSLVDAGHGTAVGSDGTIIRTTDGGVTWTSQISGTTQYLYGVSFITADTGTAVGARGVIFRTTNGGETWTPPITVPSNLPALRGVSFGDAHNGIAVSQQGRIIYTSDGGEKWDSRLVGNERLNAVSLISGGTATAAGENGFITRTINGGYTWTRQSSGTTKKWLL